MSDLGKSNSQKWVTLKEMAQLLRRCEKTFRKYVAEYEIPHIRLGRDLLFNVPEVEGYLRSLAMKTQNSKPTKDSKPANQRAKRKLVNLDKSKNKYANLLGIS